MRAAPALALLASMAQAQEPAPWAALAPCLAVHPQPTDYVRAFQDQGWKFRESGPARDEALRGFGLPYLLAVQMPPRPATPAELDALVAEGSAPAQARRFANALVFTRGDAVAALDFDPLGTGRTMSCWVAAPDLPDLDTLAFETPDFGDRPLAVEFAVPEAPAPDGAEEVMVNAWRLVSDVEPPAPLPGAEAMSVSLTRVEPRHLLPRTHGLLRAFGSDELSEAYRVPEAGE